MNKRYLIVELHSQTASFRNPEFQNFHKTLQLPPPTTIFGLAGAALGLGPKATQEFFDSGGWSIGVHGISSGKANDLWKYRTLNDDKPSSIVIKELLFQNRFLVTFHNDEVEKLQLLETSFNYPAFALTMGNSDSLAKVAKISWASEAVKSRTVSNCLVEGDVVSKVITRSTTDPEFSIYSTSDPLTFDLPVRFSYKAEYGIRSVVRRKTFSFIGQPMELNFDVEGVNGKCKDGSEHFIPTLSIS